MSSWTVCIPEFLESWVIILTPAILLYLQDIVLWYTNHSVPWLFNYRLSKSSWPILHSVLLYELGQVFLDEQLDWTGFMRLKELKLNWSIDHFKVFVYIGTIERILQCSTPCAKFVCRPTMYLNNHCLTLVIIKICIYLLAKSVKFTLHSDWSL